MSRRLTWALCVLWVCGCSSPGMQLPLTPPQELHVDCVGPTLVGLRWQPAAGTRADAYRIIRNGVSLATTRETSFPDTTVSPSSAYEYVVSAVGASHGSSQSAPLAVTTPPAAEQASAPYCQSPLVASITWHWTEAYNESNGSDLWPVTWGSDGAVYTFFGDGGGFGGDNSRGRSSFGIARIATHPPLSPASLTNLYGGYNSQHAALVHGKASALIAVGSSFYSIGGIYTPAELALRAGRTSGSPDHVEIAYSHGNAYSWQPAGWSFCSARDSTAAARGGFCPIGFVNFGPGNSGAPEGQVYLVGFENSPTYWTGGDADQPGRTFLARVPSGGILERSAYRYFAGLDGRGRPVWSPDAGTMQPIFIDRNPSRPGCGKVCAMSSSISEIVYDAPLNRYIGTAQGDRIGQTSFYDAPQPWGPWTVIEYNNIDPATGGGGWAGLGSAGSTLGVHPVNAWTSADGRTLWMIYSSDGEAPPDAIFPPAGASLDSFNLVRVYLNPRSDVRSAH